MSPFLVMSTAKAYTEMLISAAELIVSIDFVGGLGFVMHLMIPVHVWTRNIDVSLKEKLLTA